MSIQGSIQEYLRRGGGANFDLENTETLIVNFTVVCLDQSYIYMYMILMNQCNVMVTATNTAAVAPCNIYIYIYIYCLYSHYL